MSSYTLNTNPQKEIFTIYVELPGGIICCKSSNLYSETVNYYACVQASSYTEYHHLMPRYDEIGQRVCLLGDITSRQMPAEIKALPARSQERSAAYNAWYEALMNQALSYLQQAFPEIAAIHIWDIFGQPVEIGCQKY